MYPIVLCRDILELVERIAHRSAVFLVDKFHTSQQSLLCGGDMQIRDSQGQCDLVMQIAAVSMPTGQNDAIH